MRIAFHSNQLSIRGTETAMFDYADFNQILLGNHSLIVTPKTSAGHDELSAARFAAKFPICGYQDLSDLERILEDHKIDVLYCIKSGQNDGIVSRNVKTVVHSVFGYCEPHGQVYAYVSEWLSRYASHGKYPWVPHIVRPTEPAVDLRAELGIPKNAIVFGRHGGAETFDIPFVHSVVSGIAEKRSDIYFLFLGTNKFCNQHPQIMHLPPNVDMAYKASFIASCDAMLHARLSGETFGLAIAEFSALNKPVITYGESCEKAHIDILGENAFYYDSIESLVGILCNFQANPAGNWRKYLEKFSPQTVMERFNEVFLK